METVFGIHAVESILKTSPDRIDHLLFLRGKPNPRLQKLMTMANKQSIRLQQEERKKLDKIVEGNHQGVIAYVKPGRSYSEGDIPAILASCKADPFILVLDGVTDPHNLGACLRSADAAGIDAVIIPKDNSVGLTETVKKVACGAADHVPLIAVTNLARTLKLLQDKGLWIAGAAGEATQSVYEVALTGPRVIVMGAEGTGMRRLTREHCDDLINIPMAGSVSSLNVSVATGIVLFEVVRQRRG